MFLVLQLWYHILLPSYYLSGIFKINRNELFIKKEIGAGQFGTVHEAVWRSEKLVAVKMMKPDSMNTHDFIEEAKMMQYFSIFLLI